MKLSIVLSALFLTSVLTGHGQMPFPEVTTNGVTGFQDTPLQPGLPWHVHDPARPQPPTVKPVGAPSFTVTVRDSESPAQTASASRTITIGPAERRQHHASAASKSRAPRSASRGARTRALKPLLG